MARLEGRVAIVTGAGPGIGRAIPLVFHREGARLILVDIHPAAAEETVQRIREEHGEAYALEADVAEPSAWSRIVDECRTRYGRLDVLVNSAAWTRVAKVTDLSVEDWHRSIDVTLTSVFLGAKYCIPLMLETGGGSIVNISSVNGFVSNPGFAAYSAAKSGVLGLTRNLAIDFGLQGIRVNAICPGLIVNPVTEPRLMADPAEARGSRDPYLVGRWGSPEDVAYAALYLASDEAAFVTGAALTVDGGLTIQSPEATTRPSFRRRWRTDIATIHDEPGP